MPEFGRPIVDRMTGVAPVTPCALVSVVTWPGGSGAAGGRFTRRSAPVVKLAWSWTDRCQVLHSPIAITLVATASTASSTGPAWRTGRRLICQAATAAVRSRPRTAARSPIRATAGSSRSISTAAAASASTGAVTRMGSTPMEPSTPDRDRGLVVRELPAGQHRQGDQGQVQAGPCGHGDRTAPAPQGLGLPGDWAAFTQLRMMTRAQAAAAARAASQAAAGNATGICIAWGGAAGPELAESGATGQG